MSDEEVLFNPIKCGVKPKTTLWALYKAFNLNIISPADASEIAQARLKGLDTTNAPPQPQQKPHKDVNTFINNQLKFAPTNQNTIPPDQMKCNILKAKAEEQKYNKNGKG